MRLVPASVALARAELADRAEFARLLSAVVPDEWPPEILAETTEDNAPSMRLLKRQGFTNAGPAVEPGHVRLVLNRRADADKDSN